MGLGQVAPRYAARMLQRHVGDMQVSAIGLGAMPLSLEGRPEHARAIATIHAALDAGVTLIDTADAYSTGGTDTGHNERVIAEALHSYGSSTDHVVVATKGGHIRPGDGSWQVDGRPEHLKQACAASLRALGRDVIDLYHFHRPDPAVPYAESIGALAELRTEGKIRQVGISNATVAQIDEARSVVPIASVQNEFSPAFRSSADELAHCERLGIAFLAWGPLGGMSDAQRIGTIHRPFADVAARYGCSPQRVALAWVLAQGSVVIPIPGSSRPETVRDSAQAVALNLTADDLAQLDKK